MKKITVFGGSQPKPGDPAYQQALQLGKMLGEAGYAALTGGYVGVMEAVSRGANEAGGHVIGVTCDEIESFRPIAHNPWVLEEWRLPTLRQRLFTLIEKGDAVIVLPGGIGTLAELAETWSHLQVGAFPPRPVVVVGPEWQKVFDMFFVELGIYVPEAYRRLLHFAPAVEQAFAYIHAALED
ncbi:MAG TPA: LOG family protein [Anaerolineales bacterium]|nr:LOG family protein [Anaerolineales bacterium]